MGAVEITSLITLVTLSFAATNLDNLLLLVVLMGADRSSHNAHRLGFVVSSVAVLLLAALGLFIGDLFDPSHIGLLGLLPLGLGLHGLYRQWSAPQDRREPDSNAPRRAAGNGAAGTAVLLLGNSTDSIAVFLPLVAESSTRSLFWGVVIYVLCILVWLMLAQLAASREVIAARIEAVGERLIPFVMIGVGVYILLDTATDTLT